MNNLVARKDYSAIRRDFFYEYCPNVAIILGVLEGKIDGQVFISKKKQTCLVVTNSQFNFVAGFLDHKIIRDVSEKIKNVSKNKNPFLVVLSDLGAFFEEKLPFKTRSHFSCYADEISFFPEKVKQRLFSQYRLQKIDKNNFQQCFWKEKIFCFYKTCEDFLRFGYGAVLSRQTEVIAEVYGTIGGNFLELGAYAGQNYRGNGAVPLIISELIKKFCIESNFVVTASCDINNFSSRNTIIALGLSCDFEYSVIDIV